jgi:transposase
MTPPYRKTYRPWQPQDYRQQALCPNDKLSEDDLVFFLIDLVFQLDLRKFYAPYEDETRGAPPFAPALMVCLLLYSYCLGVRSSRKIAKACERNLAFLAIVGADRPDFRTISDFRQLHLEAFIDTFTDVLRLAKEAGLIQLGVLATDGTKMAGNASRHKAMSYGYMVKEVERLRAEIAALVQQAQDDDAAEDAVLGSRRGDELPAELARREQRLATIAAAKKRLEEAAKSAADAERQRRADVEAERERTGQRRRGRAPAPLDDTPDPKAQTNFTDPDLKIMKTNNKGWDYCGNAQAVVDGKRQIILSCDVVPDSNDKQQAVPMAQQALANLERAGIARPVDAQGQTVPIPNLTDSGYYSEKASQGLAELNLDPHMATGRQRHHEAPACGHAPVVGTASASEPSAASTTSASEPSAAGAAAASAAGTSPAATANAKEEMTAKLRTPAGRALYALRKTIVEPVFGQIKGAREIRRFLLRGLEKVRGEWRLICLTHNVLKLWRYRCAPTGI